jgi:hypothetical protein
MAAVARPEWTAYLGYTILVQTASFYVQTVVQAAWACYVAVRHRKAMQRTMTMASHHGAKSQQPAAVAATASSFGSVSEMLLTPPPAREAGGGNRTHGVVGKANNNPLNRL